MPSESMNFMPSDGSSEAGMSRKGAENDSDDGIDRYPGDVDHVISAGLAETSQGNTKTVTVFSNGTSISAVSSDDDDDADDDADASADGIKETEYTHFDSNTGMIIEQKTVRE